jgi:hypothetical protein
MSRKFLSRLLCIVALALIVVASPAAAGDDPYSPCNSNPYSAVPSSPAPAIPLTSAGAQAIWATGNLAIQHEQARLIGEHANQATIQTRRMAFDEGTYEMAQTPSYLAMLDPWTQVQVRRVMAQPYESEIVHGDTLNLLLPNFKALVDQGASSSAAPLSSDLLQSINVRTGVTGPDAGMLRDAAHLGWPLFLRGPAQVALDRQIGDVVTKAADGTLTPDAYTQVVNQIESMRTDLNTRFFAGHQMDMDAYHTSKGFLDSLETSLKVLERPDAARVLNGADAVHGNSVPELAENLTASGLQFAPATPGSEAAYFSLHNAFVSYIRTAESSAFASMVAPPHGS